MSNEFQVRDMLVLETDLIKKVTINKEPWQLKAPTPREAKEISRRVVAEQNGMPSNSFTNDDRYLFSRDAKLAVLIAEHPSWWSNPDDCIDEALKDELYGELTKWENEFHEKLKKNQFPKRGTET